MPANQELGKQEKGRLLLTSQIEGTSKTKTMTLPMDSGGTRDAFLQLAQSSEAGNTSTMKKTRAREDKEDKDAGGRMRDEDDA